VRVPASGDVRRNAHFQTVILAFKDHARSNFFRWHRHGK